MFSLSASQPWWPRLMFSENTVLTDFLLTDVPPSTTSDVCMTIDSKLAVIAWELFSAALLCLQRFRAWLDVISIISCRGLNLKWVSTWERIGLDHKIMLDWGIVISHTFLVHLGYDWVAFYPASHFSRYPFNTRLILLEAPSFLVVKNSCKTSVSTSCHGWWTEIGFLPCLNQNICSFKW